MKEGVTRIKEVAFGGIRDRSVLVPMIQYFFSLTVGKDCFQVHIIEFTHRKVILSSAKL